MVTTRTNRSISVETYPTLYATDGDLIFGGLAQIARLVAFDTTLLQLIVVGIGYPVHWTKTQPFRVRDYVPAGWREDLPSGRADRFLRFVYEKLIPWVSSEYRVDPEDRCYVGDSLEGLLGLYALLTRPETFSTAAHAAQECAMVFQNMMLATHKPIGWVERISNASSGEHRIFVWDGKTYALAVTERLGLEGKGGMVRIGAVHYNTVEEIKRLGEALQEMVGLGR